MAKKGTTGKAINQPGPLDAGLLSELQMWDEWSLYGQVADACIDLRAKSSI